jgi:hypothetical protein
LLLPNFTSTCSSHIVSLNNTNEWIAAVNLLTLQEPLGFYIIKKMVAMSSIKGADRVLAAFGFVTRMSLSSTNGRSITWIIPLVQITSARNTFIFLFFQVIEYPVKGRK